MTQAEKFQRLVCNQSVRDNLRASSVRAAGFTGIVGIIDFAIRIGSTAVLARLVLPEYFGLVMMVTAVTAIADQFKDLGLSAATVQRKDISHEEVTNLFWLNVAGGLLVASIVCAISPAISVYYHEPRLTLITCILSTNFIWGGLMAQHQALLTRQLKLGYTSSVRLSSSVISTILAIVLAWQGYGYWALVWREVVRSFLIAVGMWLCFPWLPGLPSRKTDVRGLVNFGAHICASNVLACLCSGVDRFLLGRFWGPIPVAMYRQAYQLLVTPMEQALGPVYQVTQPSLCMLQAEEARFRRFYQKALKLVCVATMPLSLFVAVYSQEITRVILGKKWHDAATVLTILSFGTFIKQAVGSAAWVLLTRGRSKTYLALTVLQNATVVSCMFIGVQWGTRGVALADVAATYLLMWPMLHFCLKDSPVNIKTFLTAISRPAFASVVMYVALSLLQKLISVAGAPANLGLGALLAMIVFLAIWLVIPGGKSELTDLFSDVRHAIERKTGRLKPVAKAAVVEIGKP